MRTGETEAYRRHEGCFERETRHAEVCDQINLIDEAGPFAFRMHSFPETCPANGVESLAWPAFFLNLDCKSSLAAAPGALRQRGAGESLPASGRPGEYSMHQIAASACGCCMLTVSVRAISVTIAVTLVDKTPHADVHHDPKRQEREQHRRPAVTQQRQRDPGHRHQPDAPCRC